MTRRIFLDTEWTGKLWAGEAELMWIGLADEDGRTWYGVSSEVNINPSGIIRYISPDEPRLTNRELATAVIDFCGDVDEFWTWIPTLENLKKNTNLGSKATEMYARYWNIDLQLTQSLVQPWPTDWPDTLQDLNAAATKAGVKIPPKPENFLHPRVHVEWNRELFKLIQAG